MCDLLQTEDGQIIKTDEEYSKAKILTQRCSEDENAKDSAPEVIGKSDACNYLFLKYI